MVTRILPRLFLGDEDDARVFKGARIAVVTEKEKRYRGEKWVRMSASDKFADLAALEQVAKHIDLLLPKGPTLVRCGCGVNRSPLCIAYWLVTRRKWDWERAYRKVIAARPEVMDERRWLPEGYLPPP